LTTKPGNDVADFLPFWQILTGGDYRIWLSKPIRLPVKATRGLGVVRVRLWATAVAFLGVEAGQKGTGGQAR
jgi:hypothetical protein